MKEKFKAFHIDAKNKTIKEIEITRKNPLSELQKLVGGYIQIGLRFQTGDVLFVDEEGLLKDNDDFFALRGHSNPFAGSGVIVGTDGPNDDDAKITLEQLEKAVIFLKAKGE